MIVRIKGDRTGKSFVWEITTMGKLLAEVDKVLRKHNIKPDKLNYGGSKAYVNVRFKASFRKFIEIAKEL